MVHESDIAAMFGGPSERFFTALGSAAGELSSVGEKRTLSELIERVEAVVADSLSSPA